MCAEIHSFKNTNENPCKMCMPMGGILAFKGVKNAMVILHGSQGCATYMRRHIAEHFNEPVDVASSSLNEKGTIYGGEAQLKQGVDNMLRLYKPDLIGILTTCLAETIGEDIGRISAEYLAERGMDGYPLVPVPTPGYGDSHFEGFFQTARTILERLAKPTERHGRINIIVPHISPADIRELKRIITLFDLEFTLFPDFSDTLDAPFTRPYQKIPAGGTPVDDIAAMAGAAATIQFGVTVDRRHSPGAFLHGRFGVPLYNIPLPVGIEYNDRFLQVLEEISGTRIPDALHMERGRLVDALIDAHKITYHGRAAIFGEPEQVYAWTRACLEFGTTPAVVGTGSKSSGLRVNLEPYLAKHTDASVLTGTDFTTIRELSGRLGVNIAIGNSDGKVLTEKERIPLVRAGFPIHDRKGGQRILTVGYSGAVALLDSITNTLLESKLTRYRQAMFESYYLRSEQL